MNKKISKEIQSEQDHGREKYGFGPDDFEHDDFNSEEVWRDCIKDHNERARLCPPMARRQHLIKVAGLAVSAIEALDRQANTPSQTSNG